MPYAHSILRPAVPVLALLAIALAAGADPVAWSQHKYPLPMLLRVTRDQAILQAFELMPGTRAEAALDHVVGHNVRVFFKDLGELNRKVRHYDALSWMGPNGERVIFINRKHAGAPPAALAALIAHEVIHADLYNSVREEIAGWQEEARTWQELKQRFPDVAASRTDDALVQRLDRLEAEYRQGTLDALVRRNPGYKGLPEQSPGFAEPEEQQG